MKNTILKWSGKIFILLFMLTTIVGIGYAETTDKYTEGYYTYTLDADGNAIITAYSGTEENIVVPSTLDGHKVIAFDSGDLPAVFRYKTAKTITIPDGVKSLENGLFANCASLHTVTIPGSVQQYGQDMFEGDEALENIFVSNDSSYTFDIDGVFYTNTIFGITLEAYPANKPAENFTIPLDVDCISNGAFYYCSNLKKIIFPSGNIKLIMRSFKHATLNAVSIYLNSKNAELAFECFAELPQGSKIYVKNSEMASKLSGYYSSGTTTIVDLSSLSDADKDAVTTPAISINFTDGKVRWDLEKNYDFKGNLNDLYTVLPTDTTDAVTWTSCVLDPVTGNPTGTEQPVDSAKAYGPGKPQYVRLTATTDSGKSIAMYVRYQKDLKECSLPVSAPDLEYTGAAQKPKMDVYYYVGNDKTLLTEDVDYKVDFIKNTDAGTSSYTVSGINNYKGSKDGTFEIKRKSIEGDKDGNNYLYSITLDCDSFTYDGTAKTPDCYGQD